MSVHDYMRAADIQAFMKAAHRFRVWILLRASNPAAKPYIGIPGFVPKRFDCKAKTADRNVVFQGIPGEKQLAGLVVDVEIPGMFEAFNDVKKMHKAEKEWQSFKHFLWRPKPGERPLTYIPGGKFYTVQVDPKSPHYGCVMFSTWSNIAGASYIHSDYDLFGIVPADDPTSNIRVREKLLGMDHCRGPELFDIQTFLNKSMGVPMVLHGDQEKYKNDLDDKLDVFFPDGRTVESYYSEDAIRRLYDTTFKGRRLFGGDGIPRPFFGRWEVMDGARSTGA